MSAIETLRMKLLTGEYTFKEPPLVLKHDERYGTVMPYLPRKEMFLDEARRNPRTVASRSDARSQAKALFYTAFVWECGDHGNTMHHTATGRCALCFRDSKRSVVPAREEAQRDGSATYLHSCIVHGECDHSTARGLCLCCYNSLGQPRPLATNPKGVYVNREGGIKNSPR